MTRRNDIRRLRSGTDFVVAGYLLTTALLATAFRETVPSWQVLVPAHLAVAALVCSLSFLPESLPRALQLCRDWYPVLLLPLLFKEVEVLAAGFGNCGLTDVLQRLEVSWFGGHPSMFLSERLPWIYGRFHYAVDVLAGLALAALVIRSYRLLGHQANCESSEMKAGEISSARG